MTQNTEKLLTCLAELNCKIEKTEEGAILITPSAKREPEEANKEPKFKDGDFVVFMDNYDGKWIFIYDRTNEVGYISAYCYTTNGEVYTDCKGKSCFNPKDEPFMYKATKEDEQLLLDALHNIRKIWNPETRTIEEDRAPTVGDLVAVWMSEEPKNVVVGRLKNDQSGYRIDTHSLLFTYCVRFEDFDFKKMKPKEL